MTARKRLFPMRILALAVAGVITGTSSKPASAGIWAWNNGTSNWNSAANWTSSTNPGTVPSSSSSTELDFGGSGSTAYTSNNDISSFVFGTIKLNSSASVAENISGNFSSTTNEEIQQNGSGAFAISSNFTLSNATLQLDGSGTGTVTLSGTIANLDATHLASVIKSGSSTVVLSGANTFGGTLSVQAGTLKVAAGALPTGTIVAFTNTSGTATLDITGLSQTIAGMTFGTQTTGTNTVSILGNSSTSLTLAPASLTFAPLNTASNLTVSMATLGNFTYNNSAGTFAVNNGTQSGQSGSVIVTLAGASGSTNAITAASLNVGNAGGQSNPGSSSVLNLGNVNTFFADSIGVGNSSGRSSGTIQYASGLSGTESLKIRDHTGSSAATVTVGQNSSSGGDATVYTSIFDTTGNSATLDALISTLTVGDAHVDSSGTRQVNSNGTFKMGAGTMTITTANIGVIEGTTPTSGSSVFTGTGSLSLNAGGTTNITTLNLATDSLTSTSSATNMISGQVFLNGVSGTTILDATTIQQGAKPSGESSRTAQINWNDGTIGNIPGAGLSIATNVNVVLAGASASHVFNISTGQTGTINPVISGTGTMTSSGAGTLALLGNNTYNGATNINAGVLFVNNGSGLTANSPTSTGTVTIANAAILSIGSNGATLGTSSTSAALVINAGGIVSFPNASILSLSTGSSGLTELSLGGTAGNPSILNMTVAGASASKISAIQNLLINPGGAVINITGSAVTAGGPYNLITDAALSSGSSPLGSITLGTITNGGNFTYALGISNITFRTLILTAVSAPSNFFWKGASNSAWSTDTANSTNWVNAAGTDPGILPTSASTVTLTATSANNLTTTLGQDFSVAGVVFSGSGSSAATGTVTIGGSNTLTIGAAGVTVNTGSTNHIISSAVALSTSQTWTVTDSSNILTASGPISGSTFGITKSGAGTLSLSASNSYSGGTTINSGQININHANAIGTGTLTLLGGNIDSAGSGAITLATNNAQAWKSDFTFAGSNALNLGTGAVAMSASRQVTVSASTLTVGGGISGSGFGLTKAGNGVLVLTSTNTYTGGTTVTAGMLELAPAVSNVSQDGLYGSSGLTVTGGTVQADSDNALTGSGGASGNIVPVTINAGGTLTGLASADSGTGPLVHIRGLLTISGGTLASGGTGGVNSGSWDLDGGVAAGGVTTTSTISAISVDPTQAGGTIFNVSSGATNGIDLDVTSILINGAILHDTGIIKTGTGVMRLNGSNTYAGTTAINNGTLTVNAVSTGSNAQSLGESGSLSLGVAGASSGKLIYTGGTGMLDKNINILGNGSDTISNTGGGTLTLSGTATKNGTILNLKTGTFFVSGKITGAAGGSDLNVDGSTVTLSNTTNDYNGPTVVFNAGTLISGTSNVLPNASTITLGNVGTAGTWDMKNFTDTTASLSFGNTGGGTIKFTLGTDSSTRLTTTGNVDLSHGILNFDTPDNTVGKYTLIHANGALSNAFVSTSSVPGTFQLITTTGTGGEVDLVHKADQALTSSTPATIYILAGKTIGVSATLANAAPNNSTLLNVTLADNSGTGGTVSLLSSTTGATVASGTPSTITGTLTAGSAGIGQTWSFKNTDSSAITTTVNTGGTVNVYNPAQETQNNTALTLALRNSATGPAADLQVTAAMVTSGTTQNSTNWAINTLPTISQGSTGTVATLSTSDLLNGNYAATFNVTARNAATIGGNALAGTANGDVLNNASLSMSATVAGVVSNTGHVQTFLHHSFGGYSLTNNSNVTVTTGPTTASFLDSQITTADRDIRMTFSAKDQAFMASDKVAVTGTGGDVFYVIEMTYDIHNQTPTGTGNPYLGYQYAAGLWKNAALTSSGTLTAILGNYDPAADFHAGYYGDTTPDGNGEGYAWAVVEGDNTFAVIPEPTTLGFLSMGFAGLFTRRKRQRNTTESRQRGQLHDVPTVGRQVEYLSISEYENEAAEQIAVAQSTHTASTRWMALDCPKIARMETLPY